MNKCTFLTLVLCFFASMSFSQSCPGNMIVNPGFENGTNGWVITSGAPTIVSNSNSGSSALQLGDGSFSPNVTLNQAFAIAPNTTYTFSGFGRKNSTLNFSAQARLRFFNSSWQPISSIDRDINDATFRQFLITQESPANATFAAVEFIFTAPQVNGAVVIDDICFIEGVPPTGGPCSVSALVTITPCYDRETPNDPSDDGYNWILDASVIGGGSSYTVSWIMDGRINSFNSDYGRELFVGQNFISNGILNLTITDNTVSNCQTTAQVVPPPTCSGTTPPPATCTITATNVNVTPCNNRNTSDPSDDIYDFVVDVTATNGGTGYIAEWTEAGVLRRFNRTYPVGIGQQFNRISNGTLTLTLTDNANPVSYTHLTLPTICSV